MSTNKSESIIAENGPEAAGRRAADFSGGTNLNGVRLYNERLVLSLIRQHGSLPKAEIARLTGLSATTIMVIMRQLHAEGLVVRHERQRGKVGQPLVPFALNPWGALSLGLKIGRRSSDLILMDFAGGVRATIHKTHPYPVSSGILEFIAEGIKQLTQGLTRQQRSLIMGLGIALPFDLSNWEEELDAPRRVLDDWRTFDVRNEIPRICPWPVFLCNDGRAACGAELTLGTRGQQEFLYFFIGLFLNGGVVLKGSLYPGHTGNAGALGSMPITEITPAGDRDTRQLIRRASIYLLEQELVAAGQDPSALWRSPDDWSGVASGSLDDWIEEVAKSLAFAVVTAISVIDFPAVIIDGAFPTYVRSRIVARTIEKIALLDHRGLSLVEIEEGSVGIGACAIGSACLPLLAKFGLDREVLFKLTGSSSPQRRRHARGPNIREFLPFQSA
jgi:predicted NBD/HSP70 family sugar kinase/biotin operon repressor